MDNEEGEAYLLHAVHLCRTFAHRTYMCVSGVGREYIWQPPCSLHRTHRELAVRMIRTRLTGLRKLICTHKT